jgi:hypothetical protein
VLYQLSYSHRATGRPAAPGGLCRTIVAERGPSPSSGFRVARGTPTYSIGRFAAISAAMVLAVSTSGPGTGTNTVLR